MNSSLGPLMNSSAGDPMSCQDRIVGKSFLLAGIEGCLIRLVERRLDPIALRQVGIGEKNRPESDEIGFTAPDHGIGAGEIEAAIHDVGARELSAQDGGDALVAIGSRIDDMKVDDAELVELFGEMRKGLDRIGV